MTSVHHQFITIIIIIIIIIIPSLSCCISTTNTKKNKLNPFHHSPCSSHPSTYLGLIFIRFSLAISFHFAARSFLSSLLNTIVFSLDLLSLKGFLFINLGKFFSASCFSSCFPWSGYPFDILLFFPRFNIN